jgi:hypothetical protein
MAWLASDKYEKAIANAAVATDSLCGRAMALPVQDMLGLLAADINHVDQKGWSALMWACAMGRRQQAQALLSAGCDPNHASTAVVSHENRFYHVGMDAGSIAMKAGNFDSECRRLAHYMFHINNADQRLVAAYRRLLLAAGLEAHMERGVGSCPLAWLEIELVTIAGCVSPVTPVPVVHRFQEQGFAWHGGRRHAMPTSFAAPEPEQQPQGIGGMGAHLGARISDGWHPSRGAHLQAHNLAAAGVGVPLEQHFDAGEEESERRKCAVQ